MVKHNYDVSECRQAYTLPTTQQPLLIFTQLRFHSLHREDSAKTNIKAGILTSLHSHDTFPPETEKPKKHSSGQWPVVTEHKGAYSCGTVGDSHSVPFQSHIRRTFTVQIYKHFSKLQRKNGIIKKKNLSKQTFILTFATVLNIFEKI